MGRPVLLDSCLLVLAALAALGLLAGCGGRGALPRACIQAQRADVLGALRGAPDHAALSDGTSISTCVHRAVDDADLQTLGVALVDTSEALGARLAHDPQAAFQLGFLIGAAERGAGPSGGVQGELLQRIRQPASFGDGAATRRGDVERGVAAGRRSG